MTPEEKTLVDNGILIILAGTSPSMGLPVSGNMGLLAMLRSYRPDLKSLLSEDVVAREILDLKIEGYIESYEVPGPVPVVKYRITLKGRDYLAANGLL